MAGRRDALNIFSNAQALTATAASTNVLDLQDALHQLGQSSKRPRVMIAVNTLFAGSLTSMDFALQDCDTVGGTYVDTGIHLSGVAKSKLVAGALIMDIRFPSTGGKGQILGKRGAPPPGPSPVRRFVQIYYTLNGGGASAGKVDAWIDTD